MKIVIKYNDNRMFRTLFEEVALYNFLQQYSEISLHLCIFSILLGSYWSKDDVTYACLRTPEKHTFKKMVIPTKY